jgi:hypothetical protein
MAKAKKATKKRPDKYKEKVAIQEDFHSAMKLLANHANTKGTKKVTYIGRNSK